MCLFIGTALATNRVETKKDKSMRKVIAAICLISLSQTYASSTCMVAEKDFSQACKVLKVKEGIIQRKSLALDSLRELQNKLLEGQRLKERLEENASDLTEDEILINRLATLAEGNELEKLASEKLEKRIIDTENDLELLNVEEQINDEIGEIGINNTQQYYKGAASVGGLVLFSFVIKRMTRSTRGQAFKRRLMAQLFPSENRIVKTGVNIGLVISIASGFFALYKLYENKQEQRTLDEMIALINQIKDQTDSIITLKEELDEMDVCYWLQFDQLKARGVAKLENRELVCQ